MLLMLLIYISRRDVKLHGIPKSITFDRDSKISIHLCRTLWKKLGTKLQFSSSHHPQTDGQTKVVNMSLGAMLRSLVKKNVREWKSLLPHIEFAYNRSTSQTTSCFPFEAVYSMNPIGPLDLDTIHLTDHFSGEADERANSIKKIHEQVKDKILKQTKEYKKQAEKHRKKVVFKEGDLMWIH